MLKKIFALLIAVLMIAGAASCGRPAEQTAAPAPGAGAAGGAPTVPWDGATITLTAYAADLGVLDKPESNGYQVYKGAVGNVEVDWELVPFSDFDSKFMLYLNSGDIPDIMWGRSPNIIPAFSTSGLFIDFNKYDDIMPNWQRAKQAVPGIVIHRTEKGEQFLVHGVDNDYPAETFFANLTMLEKYNVPVPTNLTEFEKACDALLAADSSVTPFHTFWNISYYLEAFGHSVNAFRDMYYDMGDNAWKHAVLSPESKYKELITLLAEYYEKGYFNVEFATMSDEQTTGLITSGNWGITYTYGGQVNAWYAGVVSGPVSSSDDELPIKIQTLRPLAADGARMRTVGTYVSDNPYWGYLGSANSKYPELVATWIDAMLSQPVADAFQWGAEGVSYEVVNGQKKWLTSFLDQGQDAINDMGIWYTLGPRYITWRDDTSSMRRGPQNFVDLVNILVDGIKDGSIDCWYPPQAPVLTEEDQDEYALIMAAVNTVISENQLLFVLGERPLNQWDDFVKEVLAAGNLQRAIDLRNDAPQRPARVPGRDRNYIRP